MTVSRFSICCMNVWNNGVPLHVLRGVSANPSLAFHNSDNRRFGIVVTPPNAPNSVSVSALSPDVSFVDFYRLAALTAQRVFVVVQHRANLLKHAPCGLVRYACLALDLLCGDSATSRSHQIYRIEPSRQRSRRLVKDRVGGWVNVVAAVVTRIRRAALYAVMLRDLFAVLAVDSVGVQICA